MAQHDGGGQSDRAGRQEKHTIEAADTVGEAEEHFGQPFMRVPSPIPGGEGEWVGPGNGVVVQDPFTRPDLPQRVAVAQDPRWDAGQGEQDAECDDRGGIDGPGACQRQASSAFQSKLMPWPGRSGAWALPSAMRVGSAM